MRKIFGYWNDIQLPDFIKNSMEKTIENNPDLEYEIYDDEKSRIFLAENFGERVLKAYDKIIPWAYKSDLVRYALLYFFGGIYIDLKLILNKIDEEFFKREYNFAYAMRRVKWLDCPKVENSFLYFKNSKNDYLLNAINLIVENIENNNYGNHCLAITGPGLLGTCLKNLKPTLKLYILNNLNLKKGPVKDIFYRYSDLQTKQVYTDNCLVDYYENEKRPHQNYWLLWKKRKIYKQ